MPVSASSATARKPGAASVCSVPPGAEPGAAQEVRTHARLSAIAAPAAARERVRWLINTVVTPSTVVVARTAAMRSGRRRPPMGAPWMITVHT